MSAAAAPAPLDVVTVRRKIREAREALDAAVELLDELYAGRAWVALGLPSWAALCERELPELAQLLTIAQRRELVVELRRRGHSLRSAAAPAGVSAATAKTWADDAGVQLATVTSLDGRQRPATTAPAPRPRRPRTPRTTRIEDLLREAGPDGLDVREVCSRTRLGREVVAPALTRLGQAQRVRYVPPARRGLFGRWTAW